MTTERDFDLEAQEAAEAALELIEAWAEYDNEQGPMPLEPNPDPAFCGCDSCIVRVVLDAAWPILRDAALAGAE